METRKYFFWLAAITGVLAFIAVNILSDVPRLMKYGKQAQLAERALDELRHPLLALDQDYSDKHEPTPLNESALRLEPFIANYHDASQYSPAAAAQFELFRDSLGDWVNRKQAGALSLPGEYPHGKDNVTERMDIHQLLHALMELSRSETLIQQDILKGYAATQTLKVSSALLFIYFLILAIYVQRRRTLNAMRLLAERKQAQDALVESRQMLERILNSIPVRVFWKDRNSVYLGCNRLFANDAGLDSAEEIIGKDDFSMGWKEQAELYRADDKETIESGLDKINYEEPQTTPDGSRLVLRTSKIPLRDLDGNIFGVLGCYEDITRVKQIEEELQAHRNKLEEVVKKRTREVQLQAQIIDQIHDSVVSTDLDGIVTSWNKGAEDLFGYSSKEAIGKPISFVYPEEQLENLQKHVIDPLKKKGAHETEVIMRRKDGDDFQAILSMSMLYDEEGIAEGMIGYSLDITDRKKAEAALLKQTDILEAANAELGAFSYSVSHDLRAPLRAIDGFSQLLLDDYYDSLDEAGKDYLDRVRKAAQRMAELIDHLLDLSRVGQHKLRREMVDLSELSHSIFQKLSAQDPDRSVEIRINPGLKAEGDSRLLEVLLDNLIGNAWKYTSIVDKAEIEVGSRQDGRETVFYVRDNGAGFDMKYSDKLFGTFQRLHGREFEGTGIGLATVQRIVKRHSGRVWGEGEPGKGATFYFPLPFPL
jgi:PAS domain S-box-containing protein